MDSTDRTAGIEDIILAAYRDGLTALESSVDDAEQILAHLGDVDSQASHPFDEIRFGLAGRLLAAAQLAAEGPLSEADVRRVVGARLADHRVQRDDASPAREPRLGPDEDEVTGLADYIRESAANQDLSHAMGSAAVLILQELVRPEMDIGLSLALREELGGVAEDALEVLSHTPPWGLADEGLAGLLAHIYARTRPRPRVSEELSQFARPKEADEDWLHLAVAATAAHAAWTESTEESSMSRVVSRATERLASSFVPAEPARFSVDEAREHALDVAFNSAITALALTAEPDDVVLCDMRLGHLDALLEVGSSALIGAWLVRYRSVGGDVEA